MRKAKGASWKGHETTRTGKEASCPTVPVKPSDDRGLSHLLTAVAEKLQQDQQENLLVEPHQTVGGGVRVRSGEMGCWPASPSLRRGPHHMFFLGGLLLCQSCSHRVQVQGQGTQVPSLAKRSLRIQGHVYKLPQSDLWPQVVSISLLCKIRSHFPLLHTPYHCKHHTVLISCLHVCLPSELPSRHIGCLIHPWIPCG